MIDPRKENEWELILSVQRSEFEEAKKSQRDFKNTCVGTDELEGLMVEDQHYEQNFSDIHSNHL